MRTVVLPEMPHELQRWLERRRELGQDRRDEVWEGEYHASPAPRPRHLHLESQLMRLLGPRADEAGLVQMGGANIGDADDYRIPDQTYVRTFVDDLYLPTAAVVIEVIGPGDESRRKMPFYADHGVDEVVLVDPQRRAVEWYALDREGRGAAYRPVDRSALLDVAAADLARRLEWPG